jgi:5-methylcytosine-specific restriction protein B
MPAAAPIGSLAEANDYVGHVWAKIRAHINEVFFGNTRAVSELLCAEKDGSPYMLIESTFAGQSVRRINGPDRPNPDQLYRLLKLVAAS